ncbi:MAG TPA: chorismate synthase [Candidatus Limnocylindrales bacterium]|nr:chorismate synthase [Candidatus Limnocylindrales bacterium]
MAGSSFGNLFVLTTWGESHGKAIGVVVDGCPAGLDLKEEDIQKELDRRRVGQSRVTSQRKEEDRVEILSGIFEGKTTGAPISMIVYNKDVDSSKYEPIKHLFRPGHADYTYQMKYGLRDYRGGARASARETVGRVAAGAIAKKILWEKEQIRIIGYTKQVGRFKAQKIDFSQIEQNLVRCPDPEVAKQMEEAIVQARKQGDSLGGIVEVVAQHVPPGLGEPVFDKLDADLAKALMSIPAVKGVEIGTGFAAAEMMGSEHNDPFTVIDGKIRTTRNHAGGILGGISNGEDIIVRMVVKPTSSILKTQPTVDIFGHPAEIRVEGRHDPCLCPRAVPVAEAMVALVLVDHWLRNKVSRFDKL